MAVTVTDPDNLDRSQVVFNTDQKLIYVKGVGSLKESGADADFDVDNPIAGTHRLDSSSATFVTNSVAVGDILILLTGSQNAGHWSVSAVNSETQIEVQALSGDISTPVDETGGANLSYEVRAATGGTVESTGATLFSETGVTEQALYSFSKEEWKDDAVLIPIQFPFELITREQGEIGGGNENSDWDYGNDSSIELIRTGGWADRDTAGSIEREYTGVITLGTIDSDAQVYYQNSGEGSPINFVRTGQVNQPIKIRDTSVPDDFRTFLKLFVRKKGRTYAQSEISDIGVTTIETIVNRFPLAHANDPAILDDDARVDGASPYYTTVQVDNGSTAALNDNNGTSGFLIDSGQNFSTTVIVGDTVNVTTGAFAGNYFTVTSVDSAIQLTLDTSEDGPFTNEASQTYTVVTNRVRTSATDGSISDATGGPLGFLSSAGSSFLVADSRGVRAVAANDVVVITEAGSGHRGAYKVVTVDSGTSLTVDTSDREFTTQSSIDFYIGTPGMYLESKSETRTQVSGVNITFNDNNGSGLPEITRASGDFIADGYEAGDLVVTAGASNQANNGTFTVRSVVALTLTLNSTHFGTIVDEGPAAGITVDGTGHFARAGFTPTTADIFPFEWRLFGNDQGLATAFQYVQLQLRKNSDIDLSQNSNIGQVTDLLMSFVSPNGTGLNLYIDDLVSNEINNATFQDATATNRNNPFTSGVAISLNANLLNDSANNRIVVFFDDPDGTPSTGDEYGTPGAVIVNDSLGSPMNFSNQGTSPINTDFDYDGNNQGGRTPGTDADCTVVGIGLTNAQFVLATFTIKKQNNNPVSLVSALERNYSNP